MRRKRVTVLRLTDGTETCPLCLQSYAYEMEIRCEFCDEPLCPCCADGKRACPDCTGADGE